MAVKLQRWKTSGSIYFVFTQYRIVSPYHCNTGIEVDCSDDTAVFAHCFPHTLLGMFLDGIPFCEFQPLQAIQSNRYGGLELSTHRPSPNIVRIFAKFR